MKLINILKPNLISFHLFRKFKNEFRQQKRERVWNSQVRKSQKCLNLGTRRHFGEDFFAEERRE